MTGSSLSHTLRPEMGTSPIMRRRKLRKGTRSCVECKRRKTRCIFTAPADAICVGCKSRQTKCVSQGFDEGIPGSRVQEGTLNSTHARSGRTMRHIESVCRVESDAEAHFDSSTTPLQSIPVVPTDVLVANKYDTLCLALSAAWPSEHDLSLIVSIPVGTSKLSHGVICMPYSSFSQDSYSPRELLQLPSPGSHPVLFARKLLLLGTLLQGCPSSFRQDLAGLSVSYRDIASRAIETAARIVTSNDELVSSIEGIECLMIEGMYYNDMGNLRRAYLTRRRALTFAQMMGLHRYTNASSLKILDPRTRTRIDPEYMWFRLVQADRYLSMMLGLPQGSPENTFTSVKVLEACSPMEKMERIDCVAGGRILQRNDTDMLNLVATQDIDNLLQKASACMPPQWWLIPDLCSSTDDTQLFHDSVQFMNQIAHYHLIAQLHLPYLLRFSSDHKYDYSKITTVNASRELLTRFVAFSKFISASSYCRGLDFLAFQASTALCLAHIYARCQRRIRVCDRNNGSVFSFLAHQRLSDRGLMEQTLEFMTHINNDAVTSKIASILRHLLAIEADSTNGASYSAKSSKGDEEELGCSGKVSEGGSVLHIHIPYFGTIKIERDGIFESVTPLFEHSATTMTAQKDHDTDAVASFGQEDCGQHSSDMEGYQRENRVDHIDGHWSNTGYQAIPPLSDQSATDPGTFNLNDADGTHDAQHLLPWTGADSYGYALQGVDMAFFDNLFGESTGPVDMNEISL